MRILALDLGRRKTGMAFFDPQTQIILPLATKLHRGKRELLAAIEEIITQKSIHSIVLGLPLLPSGSEGAQAAFTRSIGSACQRLGMQVAYIDERYTSDATLENDHAKAACDLLALYLKEKKTG
jgi:putative Holliday junction resolvase